MQCVVVGLHSRLVTLGSLHRLLRRIYGWGCSPSKRRPDSAARSRLYDHLRLGKHFDIDKINNGALLDSLFVWEGVAVLGAPLLHRSGVLHATCTGTPAPCTS